MSVDEERPEQNSTNRNETPKKPSKVALRNEDIRNVLK
jgi:hypothetical protein